MAASLRKNLSSFNKRHNVANSDCKRLNFCIPCRFDFHTVSASRWRDSNMCTKITVVLGSVIVFICNSAVNSGRAGDLVGLVTKTEGNPYFLAVKRGAEAKATELGITLKPFAGQYDGDNGSQVTAIEQLITDGAKGILLAPNNSAAIVPTIVKARSAGIVIITLDSPLKPPTASDAYIGADNKEAGLLIGTWARQALGAKAHTAKIVTLDGPIKQAVHE